MEEIKQFLANPNKDVDTAVSLYDKYGRNPNIKKILRSGRSSDFKLRKAVYELGKITGLKRPVVSPDAKPITNQPIVKKPDLTEQSFEKKTASIIEIPTTAPDEIKAKRDRIQQLSPEIAALHAKLKLEAKSDEERKDLAEQISNLEDEQMNLWVEIDEFMNPSETVEKSEEEIKTEIAEAEKELESFPNMHGNKKRGLLNRISTLKNKLFGQDQ